jgi:hypothetical protein
MKVIVIINNEERKRIQRENNIKNPSDLKVFFAISLECEPEDITIQMEEITPNICSTQDIVKLVMSKGDKGISIQEIKDTTLICGKTWDTERPGFLFEQFDLLIDGGFVSKVEDHYVISEEYLKRLNKPYVIKLPVLEGEKKE